jgi:hypothetical protein
MPNRDVKKMLDVPLHLNVGVKIPDLLVERCRALEMALSRPRFLLVNRARRPSAQMSKINNLRVR